VTHFAHDDWEVASTLCGLPWEGIVMTLHKPDCPHCVRLHQQDGWTFPLPMVVA